MRPNRPWLTYILILANATVAFLMYRAGAESADDYVAWGANIRELVWAGEWWRLLASMFVHIGLLHLFVNMMALHVLGPVVESVFGPIRFLFLYLVAGLAAGFTSVWWHPASISAGASGAIFGLLGALIALFLRRELFGGPDDPWGPFRQALKALALNLLISLLPGIDMAAHVGGLAVGFVIGLALPVRRVKAARSAARDPSWDASGDSSGVGADEETGPPGGGRLP